MENHENEGGGAHFTQRLTLGSELNCTTIHGETFRGNLVAQDEQAMVIVIKEASAKPTPAVSENSSVHIINLRNTAKLEIIHKPIKPPDSYTRLPQLDVERIRKRREANITAKRKEIRTRGVNVTDQAQQLFNYISKITHSGSTGVYGPSAQRLLGSCRYNDMEWDKDVIVVLRDVRISPPYDPENCEGSQPACDRIKKQVAKFHKEFSAY